MHLREMGSRAGCQEQLGRRPERGLTYQSGYCRLQMLWGWAVGAVGLQTQLTETGNAPGPF